jgi:hypothetical protein
MTPEGRPASASRAGTGSPVRETWPQPVVFWRDERVTIYHGDALDVLPALPPASASAVITDPPHDQRAQHDQHRGQGWHLGRPDERHPLVRGLVRPVLAHRACAAPTRCAQSWPSQNSASATGPPPTCGGSRPAPASRTATRPRSPRPSSEPSSTYSTSRPARVLDPFLGSGTVAAAARAAGLACAGIEAEERSCQAAARRLAVPSPAR